MCDLVLKHVPRDRAIQMLDVGCGTGSLVFLLAGALPAATLVGVDVSAMNVRAAESQRAVLGEPTKSRVRFERVDYVTRPSTPVDAVTSDGVLHLIPGDTRALFGKLAEDVRPGGVLVIDMPYDCGYNYAFAIARRCLRLVRSRWLDAVIFGIARMIHGKDMSDEGLRERVPYMYLPPQRLAGRSLRESIAPSVGLRLVTRYPMPSTSLSQLKHEVLVFEKQVA
jgi:cyclopropane fatty-acyl-phospholipid synthase-like methyltransferase